MDDALMQDDGIDLTVGELGPMLGGHARPRQSVEDREGPFRDSEGRQNGNHIDVLRGAEETKLSTAGMCSGYATASSGQGPRNTTRRKTSRKQLR